MITIEKGSRTSTSIAWLVVLDHLLIKLEEQTPFNKLFLVKQYKKLYMILEQQLLLVWYLKLDKHHIH